MKTPMVTADQQMLAQMLERGRDGYAILAAREFAARHPGAAAELAGGRRDGWRNFLAGRLAELSASVTSDCPQLLAEQIRWCESAFGARGVSVDSMRKAMHTLREVLGEELPDGVAGSVDRVFSAALDALDAPPAEPPALDPLAARYLVALGEGDRRAAWEIALEVARADGVHEVYSRILIPALKEVGRLWERNELTVAEEHFISSASQQLLPQLYPVAERREPHGKTVLVAAVGGNQHDLAIRIIGDLLEFDGWQVIQLGADFPDADLAEAATHYQGDLVVLSLALVTHVPRLIEAAVAVHNSPSKPKLLVGGRALAVQPELAVRLGADASSDSALDVVRLARELVGLPA